MEELKRKKKKKGKEEVTRQKGEGTKTRELYRFRAKIKRNKPIEMVSSFFPFVNARRIRLTVDSRCKGGRWVTDRLFCSLFIGILSGNSYDTRSVAHPQGSGMPQCIYELRRRTTVF